MPRHVHSLSCLTDVGGRIVCKMDPNPSRAERAAARKPSPSFTIGKPGGGYETVTLEPGPVTIYTRDSWSGGPYRRWEATSHLVRRIPYAQYPRAVEVLFVPKGMRKVRGNIDRLTRLSTLILAGWGHPDYDPWTGRTAAGGVETARMKFMSASPEWQEDFDRMIDEHIRRTGAKVLHDFRGQSPY